MITVKFRFVNRKLNLRIIAINTLYEHKPKGTVTLCYVSCKLSRNAITGQAARNIA